MKEGRILFYLFRQILIWFFSIVFSFSGLFSEWTVDENNDALFSPPSMTVYTENSEQDAVSMFLDEYSQETWDDPAFLQKVLEEEKTQYFNVQPGERAQVLFSHQSGVYALGWDDSPARIGLWKIQENDLVQKTLDVETLLIRFGVLQFSFNVPVEEGNYLLTVYQNYNTGSALHLICFSVGGTDDFENIMYVPPQSYDFEEAKALGYVVVMDSGVENVEALDRFIDAWENDREDSVYLIKEGKQGKPLATLLFSRGGKIIAFNDYTQIGGEVFQKEYLSIGVQTVGDTLQYYVSDVDGEGYLLFEIKNNGSSEEEEYGGRIVASTPREDGVIYLVNGFRTGLEEEMFFINVFVDSRTKTIRSGTEVDADALQLGDDIAIIADPAYTPQTPNTIRASLIWAVPGAAVA